MKYLIILFIILTTTKFSLAQSFLINEESNIISITNNGLAYNYNIFLPEYRVIGKGINYVLEQNGKDSTIHVIDQLGYVYRKEVNKDIELSDKIKDFGGRYIIDTKGKISLILRNGFFISYEKDDLFKNEIHKNGGNYLIIKKDKIKTLVTIDIEQGYYYKIENTDILAIGLDLNNIEHYGANYLIDKNGVLFTIDKTGFIYTKKDQGNYKVKLSKGNYFIDQEGIINVVLDNGFIITPTVPQNLGTPKFYGANYIINDQGFLFSVKESVNEIELKDWGVFSKSIINYIPAEISSGDPLLISF